MCYLLYAGTEQPLPRSEWDPADRTVFVTDLTDRDRPVATHFNKPTIQYVGSSSHCGCDFPFTIDYDERGQPIAGHSETEQANGRALVALLQAAGEPVVELYALWDGDFGEPPTTKQAIPLDQLLDPAFHFAERTFYTVTVR